MLPIKTVEITEMGFSGDAMARDHGDILFVPYGLPGDHVRVQITQTRDRQSWGRLVDVVRPSPDRLAQPPCRHFFDCGGCTLQHWRLDSYQAWKQDVVLGRCRPAGLVPRVVHPMRSIPPGTRRRATFCARRVGGRVVLGFNRHHSDHVVDVSECPVVVPAMIAILPDLRILMDIWMGAGRSADVTVVELDTGLDVLVTGDLPLELIQQEAIAEFVRTQNIARLSRRSSERAPIEVLVQPKVAKMTVGGVVIDPPPGCFLQPSRAGEAALMDLVLQGVGPGPGMRVADLFAGMGTFTYPMAARGADVYAADVDVYTGAVAWPVSNPGSAVGHVTPESRNLYKKPVSSAELAGFDAIVFDPPRAGAKAQAGEIAASGVGTIVAVSCNPASFVTDCAPLIAAGYVFESLTVVDQFLWTAHVELVGVFRRSL